MEAVAWAAIAVLAASTFGNIWWLGTRIDGTNARIDALSGSLNARIDALDARLDARLDNLEQRLDAHLAEHRGS
jgi:hypothetical protein